MPDDKSRRCASFNHGILESLRIGRTLVLLRFVVIYIFLLRRRNVYFIGGKNLDDWRRFILDRSIDDKREAKQACNKEIANTTMAIYALLY